MLLPSLVQTRLAYDQSEVTDRTMNSTIFSFLLLFSLMLSSIVTSQDRAPHGLSNENPVAFSPSAYEFFHPNAQNPETQDPCATIKCSPLPLVAQFADTKAYETSSLYQKGNSHYQLKAGGIAAIVFGVGFALLFAMGAYYVFVTRRANMNRATSVQPDA